MCVYVHTEARGWCQVSSLVALHLSPSLNSLVCTGWLVSGSHESASPPSRRGVIEEHSSTWFVYVFGFYLRTSRSRGCTLLTQPFLQHPNHFKKKKKDSQVVAGS